MTTWNEIPYNENEDAAEKARQFDAQVAENARIAEEKRQQGEQE